MNAPSFPAPDSLAGRILFCLSRTRAITPRHVDCDRDLPRFLVAVDVLHTLGWGVVQTSRAQRWTLDARFDDAFAGPQSADWIATAAAAAAGGAA